MMKGTLRVITVLALANLLAVAVFAGWLVASGRVDRERLARVRDIFRNTVAAERAEDARLAAQEAAPETPPVDGKLRLELPMAGLEEVAASSRIEDRAQLAARSLVEQQRRLAADLEAREAELAAREAQFVERQRAWEESIAAGAERQTNEQFRKTVRLLESAPPRQAREWVLELVQTDRVDLAVEFLDAMNPAKSSALLKAFRLEGDSKVATQLLDRLRTLGLEGETGTFRADAVDPAQSQAESADPGRGSASPRTPASGGASAGGGPVPNGPISLPGSSRPRARADAGGVGVR